MRIYMLNPPFMPHFGRSMRWQDTGRGGTLYYPIWLAYATGVLEQDHEVRLVDAPAWGWELEKVKKDVMKFEPDIVVLDSSFPSLENDVSVANSIKEVSDCKTVMVGPPTSQFPERILKKGLDIVARYEYDFTLRELAEALGKNNGVKDVEGISYRNGNKIVHNETRDFIESEGLDEIPFVSKVYEKHLNIEDYFLSSSLYPEVQIFTSRGCPFRCTFCSWPETLMGREHRKRSISNILDELEWIENNLDVNEVFFEDDTFTIDEGWVQEFCERYRKRDLDITWACNARAGLNRATMKEMKEANCRLMIVGYESGCDKILKNVNKGLTVDQSREFARNAREENLLVHGDFIIGLPGENEETIEKTKDFIDEVKPEILQVSVASPFPGTEFYEWAKKNGYLVTEDPNEYLDNEGHQKSVVSYPWLSSEEIRKKVDETLKSYYISPDYIPLAFRQVARREGIKEGMRLMRSAKGFFDYIG